MAERYGRVFILESPNPLDLLENRSERLALEQVCKLVGHQAATFLIRDADEFAQTISYIASIPGDENDTRPLFLHLSVHGNAQGLAFGSDLVSWDRLAAGLLEMYTQLKYYHGPVVLILSACKAHNQSLTAALTTNIEEMADAFVPPEYVFVFQDDDVYWADAVVTWTVFYREVAKLNLNEREPIQQLLSRICNAQLGNLRYFRWDGAKYVKFTAVAAKL